MEQVKFLEEIRTLEAFFEKKLSIEQATDWYSELKDFPIEKLRIAIREAKTNCKFMPKLAEFLEFIRQIKLENQEEEKIECKKCNGTGYLIYIKKILNGNRIIDYPHACVCNCGNARQYYDKRTGYSVPSENEILSQDYRAVTKEQDGRKIFICYEEDIWQ